MLGLPHIQIQAVTTLSLLFLFCKKYVPQNHSPGSRTTIELFQTYSYKFYFYSLNFQIDCPSSSSISYMHIDLKCRSITQRIDHNLRTADLDMIWQSAGSAEWGSFQPTPTSLYPSKAPGTTCKEMLHFFLFISSSPLLFLLLFPFPLLSFPLVFLLSPPPASILITKVTQITTPSLFHMNWNFFLHLNKDLVTFEIGFSLLLIPFKTVMCIFLKHLFTCNQRTENEIFFPSKLAEIY